MYANVFKEFSFCAAHRLSQHLGKCKNIHGHTYKVRVEVYGPIYENGIVMDYGDLKELVDPLIETLDHSILLNVNTDIKWIELMCADGFKVNSFEGDPTAENLAIYILTFLRIACPEVLAVTVMESETTSARIEGV